MKCFFRENWGLLLKRRKKLTNLKPNLDQQFCFWGWGGGEGEGNLKEIFLRILFIKRFWGLLLAEEEVGQLGANFGLAIGGFLVVWGSGAGDPGVVCWAQNLEQNLYIQLVGFFFLFFGLRGVGRGALKTRESLEFGLILSGFCKFWPSQIFS
jgi:hypothetical protein